MSESDEDSEADDERLNGMYIDKNCDQIRRMIHQFIESGEMKVGQFRDAINVTSGSYLRFMGQSGRDKGMGSDTFDKAWAFFKKRELAGKPMPKKKAKTAANKDAGIKKPGCETAGGHDLSGIHLDGEENDNVAVHDSCDEIRKKINVHLRKEGIVTAAFLRDLQAQYHTSKAPSKIQNSQLSRFRGNKGADAGNTSCIYYASYCFFEKLRIAEGKKKSAHRVDMEKIWGRNGMDKDRIRNHYWCPAGKVPVQDKYGRVTLR